MHDMATKAIYNNILFQSQHAHDEKASKANEEWQSRNWRNSTTESLFSELHSLGIHLDKPLFLAWARESDSPEDLLLLLAPDESEEEGLMSSDQLDHLYLLLFELWRRFLPERRCLSIIADDIDHAIYEYDSLQFEDDEKSRVLLSHKLLGYFSEYVRILQITLDQLHDMDEGQSEELQAIQKEGFSSLEHAIFSMSLPFFVHDIRRFIFDFTLEELNHETYHDFAPIVESIAPFITPQDWGVCMKAHVVWYEDEERSSILAREASKQIFSSKKQKKKYEREDIIDITCGFGILLLAAKSGDKGLFYSTLKSILELEQRFSPDELFELISICVLYLETVDHPSLSQVSALLEEMEAFQGDHYQFQGDHTSMERFARATLRRILEG